MSNVTLEAIENLFDSKLEEKLEAKLEEKLAPIRTTLDNHTAILEQLTTQQKNKTDENTVSVYRVDRLEAWAEKAGSQIGVPLEL